MPYQLQLPSGTWRAAVGDRSPDPGCGAIEVWQGIALALRGVCFGPSESPFKALLEPY